MIHEDYMRLAIEEAEKSVREGNYPFSVVVVDGSGEVVWKDHDRVDEQTDPTAHGEINAIRTLCPKLGKIYIPEMTFYTTSEPCPTCMTACIKAHVKAVYFGVDTESTASLPIKASELASRTKECDIKVVGGILGKECLDQRNRLLEQIKANK